MGIWEASRRWYIKTGADETLLDDSRKLMDLARKSGVDVTLEIVPPICQTFLVGNRGERTWHASTTRWCS
jgi:hypothetical protein